MPSAVDAWSEGARPGGVEAGTMNSKLEVGTVEDY
ncbi:MAG: hypothetical protein QOI84_1842, partial [Solirubrobacterales bacterium]|nr:hypothetical protein [Solirubrobacterales bacterium]